MVLVRGEAGIGKTALVRTFIDQARDKAHVLWGGCDDLFTPSPLAPVWDMADKEPDLAQALQGEPLGVFRVVTDLLSRGLRPTVVVIEDTQWTDEATLDLIRYVGRRIEDKHGLLVLTYRDEEVPEEGGLRTVFGDLPTAAVSRIRLQALSKEAVARMATAKGKADDQTLALTGGNPLLVTEVLLDPTNLVPASLTDAYRTRLARLSPEARQLVELVSVVPTRIEMRLLDKISPDYSNALTECRQRGILEATSDTVGFRHELARLAVETDLADTERQDHNRAIVAALIETGGDPARIVHHAQLASDTKAIVRYGPKAALESAAANNHQDALFYHRLIEPHLEEMALGLRAQLLAERAQAERRAGTFAPIPDLGKTAASIYIDIGQWTNAGTILDVVSDSETILGRLDEAERDAKTAMELLDGHHGRASAECSYAIALFRQGRRDAGRAHARSAVQLAQVMGDLRGEAVSLLILAELIAGADFSAALEALRAAVQKANLLMDNHMVEAITRVGASIAISGLDPETATTWNNQHLQLSKDLGYRSMEIKGLVNRAVLEFDRGQWDMALKSAQKALDQAASIDGFLFTDEVLRLVGQLRLRKGDSSDSWFQEALKVSKLRNRPDLEAEVWVGLSEAAWLTDRPIDEQQALWAIDESFGALIREPSTIAFWLWKLGHLPTPHEAMIAPHRLQVEGDWRGAADFWAEKGMPYEQAIALADGDEEAKLQALAIFDQLGAKPMASRLRKDLRAAGVKGVPRAPRSSSQQSDSDLTARQLEVLDLLSRGMSNAEIADELFISTRTAEHHVAAVIAKLEADDRHDAAAKATERGLVNV